MRRPVTAEQAMEEIWAMLSADCGPSDYENIVIAVWNATHPQERKPMIRRGGPELVFPLK